MLRETFVARLFLAAATAVLFCTPLPAQAQSENRVAAEALFRRARELLEEGKYAEACEKLEASQRLDAAVGTLLNLARCYEQIGRTAAAWATYREAIALARASGQMDRADSARRAADALEPKLPRLTIEVSPEAADQHVSVSRDGVGVGPQLWGVPIPIDPGKHRIEATAPDSKPWSSVVVAEASNTASVTVPALEAAPAGASTAVEPAPEPQSSSNASSSLVSDEGEGATSWNGQRTLALVFGGVSIAGGVFALVEGLRFQDKAESAKEECPDRCDDPELSRANVLRDEASQARTLGFVGGAIGGAALITGVVLWVTAGDGSAGSANDVLIQPVVGGNDAGVFVRGVF
jgi:hypothetical protein